MSSELCTKLFTFGDISCHRPSHSMMEQQLAHYQQFFTAVLLQQCNQVRVCWIAAGTLLFRKLELEEHCCVWLGTVVTYATYPSSCRHPPPALLTDAAWVQAEQPASMQDAAGAGLQAGMRDALVQEILKAGTDTAALQALLSGCAGAVLRVGQVLHASAQQQVVQDALQAMQDATHVMLHTARDHRLLQLVQDHVPAVAAAAGKPQAQVQDGRRLAPQGLEWLGQCPQAAEVWSAFAGMVDWSSSAAVPLPLDEA